MTHGSLFSGIGGFDLAAQWMGWENVFHVERDPFCRQVLNHHFPQSQSFDDVKTFNATDFHGCISVISGGFPCQPFSAAGQRAGTSDDRYLWPEMFRIICEACPTYVVAENVRGLTSWNGGAVLDKVCADLESEGYEVFPVVLPAASVNAPHRRERIWIVATNANNKECKRGSGSGKRERQETEQGRNRIFGATPRSSQKQYAANANAVRLQQRTNSREMGGSESEVCSEGNQFAEVIEAVRALRDATNPHGSLLELRDGKGAAGGSANAAQRIKPFDGPRNWQAFPTVAPVCGRNDGLPKVLDNITFPKWRRESVKAYGNAIVPQVAFEIFKAIEQTHGFSN